MNIKISIYIFWLLAISGLGLCYLVNPEIASPNFLVSFIRSFEQEMLLIYITLTLVRGFLLIPSTPFVIGGGILFPEQLLLVLAISMLGVMFSATSLYYFSDILGFSKYLTKKYPKEIEKWEARLRQPRAICFVMGWSFFPFVPTDLICYVSGIIKMPFKNMFIGVFIGELILDIGYVYLGSNFLNIIN